MATRSRRQKAAAVRYDEPDSSSDEDRDRKENKDEESDSDIQCIESSSVSESDSDSGSDSEDDDSPRKAAKKTEKVQQEVLQEQISSDQKDTEVSSCPVEESLELDDHSKDKVSADSETTNDMQQDSSNTAEDGEVLVAQKISDTTAVWDTFLFTITAVVTEGTTMPCPVCSKELNIKEKLMKHINAHHKNVKNPFKCEQCEDKFPNWLSLKRHVKSNHKEKETFQCQRCNKVYKTQHLLNSHCQKAHADIKPIQRPRKKISRMDQSEEFVRKERERDRLRRMKRKMNSPLPAYLLQCPDPPYKCPDCPLDNFLTKLSIQRHYAQAHKSRPFICELCGKGSITANQLTLHMTTVHSDDRPFVCDQCGVRCKRKTHLDMHINTVHSYEGKKAIQEQYRVRRELKKQREQKLAYLSQEF